VRQNRRPDHRPEPAAAGRQQERPDNRNCAAAWTYDEFGNRLSQTKVPGSNGSPPEITLTYGEATNRITTSGYTYDLNGNLTAMPSVNGGRAISGIQWDVFDRMSGTSVPGTTRLFSYDAFGRRMDSGTYPYGHHIHFYDMSGRLLAEYGNVYSGATPTKKYEYFAGQQLGQYKDRVGSVRSGSGANSHYYPFGEEITSTANDRYKFAETYRDADSGLDYAMNRYYAASIGRFLSPDRLGKSSANPSKPMSWNRYSYAEDDPVNGYDPAGMVTIAVGDGWFVECNFFDTGDPFCYVWAFGPGPGPGPGTGGTVPADPTDPDKACPDNIKNFFVTMAPIAQTLAEKWKTDLNFILALSAYESGWLGQHAQDLHNPFGLTKGGGRDLSFPTYEAAAAYWSRNFGSYIAGTRTVEDFVAKLQPHYNFETPSWTQDVADVYDSVLARRKKCGQ
jgi:RHS repeat-associated protein